MDAPLRHLSEVKEALREPIKQEVRDILARYRAGMTEADWEHFLTGWRSLAERIRKGAALIRKEQAAGRPIDEYLSFYALLLEVMGFYCLVARVADRTFYDRHIMDILERAE